MSNLLKRHNRPKRISRSSRHGVYTREKKKDFAWHGRKRNPIKDAPRPSKKMRHTVYLVLIAVSILGMFAVVVYHPFFHITRITVDGTERLSSGEIINTVEGALSYKVWFLFPGDSFFFVNTHTLSEILLERFPLDAVTLQKTFPHALAIQVRERLSTVVYDNGHTYHYMGLTGKIVEPIRKVTPAEWRIEMATVTSTGPDGIEIAEQKEVSRQHTPDVGSIQKDVGEYPLVVDITHQETVPFNEQLLQEHEVAQIIGWYETLRQELQLTPRYIDITSRYNATFFTSGPTIVLTLAEAEGSAAQIDRLKTVLKEIPDGTTASRIDVRYPGRVYWQ